jgi:hypothetical protein
MKKSYHSNAVPAEEAIITRAIDIGLWRRGSAMLAMTVPPEQKDSAPIPPPASDLLVCECSQFSQ